MTTRHINFSDALDLTDAPNFRQMGNGSVLQAAQGLLAETVPETNTVGGATAAVSGSVYFQQIYLKKGQIITTSYVCVVTAAAGPTLEKVGLYDTAGNLLASSADQSANWTTTGYKGQAFTVPYVVLTSGIYYAAWLATVTVTMPSLNANLTPNVVRVFTASGVGGGRPILYGVMVGQVDLPNPLTVAVGTTPGRWWIGLA